jgi:hypothetical protein
MEEPEGVQPGAAMDAVRSCSWCGATATPDATQCADCGAALAQRESIGDLLIPGLTSVDPALQDFDKRPLHLRGPSPSQGMAPALIIGAMAGGPIGIAAIGGVAAVAAAEYIGGSGGGRGGDQLREVGRPSEVVLKALEHLEDDEAEAPDGPEASEASAGDDGRSIWRDLPEQRDAPADGEQEDSDGG